MVLLNKLGIRGNSLSANHKFNEYGKAKWFIEQLASGKDIAVITDAGTPCISDPGNELIRAAGYTPHSDSISLRVEYADEELAEKLQIDVGAGVIVCEKRVLAGSIPVIYSVDYLALSLFDGMSYADIDWSEPIFDILDRHCGLIVVTDIARVSATNATPAIRQKLGVPDGDALLLLDEVGFCKLSRPVLRSLEFYTDFFDFTMLRKKF